MIGFDIITNDKFKTENGQTTFHKPAVAEKPKVWDIIESQKVLNNEATPMNQDNKEEEENRIPFATSPQMEPVQQAPPQRLPSHRSEKSSNANQKTVLSNVCVLYNLLGWSSPC